MDTNKYWDEHGLCRKCRQPPEGHVPTDLKDPANGVRCIRDAEGNLLPHVADWMKPLIIGTVNALRGIKGKDSYVLKAEVERVRLEYEGRIADLEAEHERSKSYLQEAIGSNAREADDIMRRMQSEFQSELRRTLRERDQREAQLRAALNEAAESHRHEIQELIARHEREIQEIETRHEADLERFIAARETAPAVKKPVASRAAKTPPPPPIPKAAKEPKKPQKDRQTEAELVAKAMTPIKLPGLPPQKPKNGTHLAVVEGGLR